MERSRTKSARQGLAVGGKTARMASYIMIAKLLSFLMVGAAFLIIVRLLGPDVYGIYTIAIAAAGLFGALGSLGIATALTKFVPEYKEKRDRRMVNKTVADGAAVLFIIGAAFAIVTFLLSGFLAGSMHNPEYAPVIQVASLVVLFSTLFNAMSSVLVGLGDGQQYTMTIVAMTATQAGLSIVLALLGWGAYAPLVGLILGYVVGLAFALAFIYLRNSVSMVRPSLQGMKDLVKFSWPIGASGVMGSAATNLVPIILGMFATSFVLGNFGAVSKVSTLMDIATGSIGMALLPSFASSFARGESKKSVGKYYAYSVHFSFVLLAPVIIAAIMLATPVSITAFSGVYSLTPDYIRVFALGLLVSIFGIYTSQLLISANKVRKLIKYTIALTAVQLALIPVMIPLLGGMGAVLLLYLLTPIATDVLFISAIKKDFGIGLWFGKLARAMAANAAMALILVPVLLYLGNSYVSIIAAAALIFIAYPPLIALTRGLNGKDLQIMRNVMRGMPVLGHVIGGLVLYASRFSG